MISEKDKSILRKLAEEVAEIAELPIQKEKIDRTFLQSEEFFSLFQNISNQVLRTYEKEKIALFRNIFITNRS